MDMPYDNANVLQRTIFFDQAVGHWVLSFTENDQRYNIDLKCRNKNGHQEALAEARKYIGDKPVRVKG